MPDLEFLRSGLRARGLLKLVVVGPFDCPVHPAVVEGGGDVAGEVGAVPIAQVCHGGFDVLVKGAGGDVVEHHRAVLPVDGRMVVKLQFLGLGERPIVLGFDGLDDACPAGVAGVVMAGVVYPLHAVGRVVG